MKKFDSRLEKTLIRTGTTLAGVVALGALAMPAASADDAPKAGVSTNSVDTENSIPTPTVTNEPTPTVATTETPSPSTTTESTISPTEYASVYPDTGQYKISASPDASVYPDTVQYKIGKTDELAETGSNIGNELGAAATLVGVGTIAVLATRKRKEQAERTH